MCLKVAEGLGRESIIRISYPHCIGCSEFDKVLENNLTEGG